MVDFHNLSLFSRVPRGVVLKYYLYMATTAVGFATPIWQVYLLARGLSYTQIFILDAIFAITIVFGETPTGYVGDRLGRRTSILIGIALLAVSLTAFGFAHSFWAFALLYGLWALGATFKSGSVSAWLYDILARQDTAEDFAHIRGRGKALQLSVTAVSALFAGYLATIDFRYPFIATGCITALGFVVVLRFPRSAPDPSEGDGGPTARFSVTAAVSTVRETVLNSTLRALLVYMMLSAIVLAGMNTLIQPTVLQVGTQAGLSTAQVTVGLGWMYASFTALSALGGYFVGDIKERIGLGLPIHVAPLILGIFFASVTVVPLLAIPAFFLMKPIRTVVSPLQSQYINDHVPSLGRATVLSAVSMLKAVIVVPFYIGMGQLTDRFSPIVTVTVLGWVLLLGSLSVLLWRKPVSTT